MTLPSKPAHTWTHRVFLMELSHRTNRKVVVEAPSDYVSLVNSVEQSPAPDICVVFNVPGWSRAVPIFPLRL